MSIDISLLNPNQVASLSESNWTVNTMKTIQYFSNYISNTYLVDARNLLNEDLLKNLVKSDIFGCFIDMRNVQGNYQLNQLVVAGSQGIVIFYSFEKQSNNVMKTFFQQISKASCYGKNFTSYRKMLHAYSIPLECNDIESNDQYKNYQKFRSSYNQISSTFDEYRTKTFSQSASTNTVLSCVANAFEAASIYYFFSEVANQLSVPQQNNSAPVFPSNMLPPGINQLPPGINHLPPGIYMPQQPPGLGFPPGINQFPPGIAINSHHANSQIIQNVPHPTSEPKAATESKPNAPILPNMLKSNNQKASEINKQFWKNLETLVAVLSSTKKIDTSNGHFYCKACNQTFDTYVYLLEHCWMEHQSALE